jgi:hypothetical protein
MPPYFHPCWWPIADGDQERIDWPFQVRDALAFREKAAVLRKLGYEDGRAILNFPPPGREPPPELTPIDTSWSRPSDLFCSITRIPALDHLDGQDGPRKRVPRGYTDLEDEIMDEWSPYVESSREMIKLNERLHEQLPPGRENRAIMKVYQLPFARYDKLSPGEGRRSRKYSGEEHRTPVFLLRIPRMEKRRAGYLGVWGLDGNTTLIWATILRFRHPELLASDHFVMAELIGGTKPEHPLNLDFAADWKVEVLIDEKIRRGGKKDERASVPVLPRKPRA